ncbi:MAG TPA: hypothetical protein VJ721_05010, partial [Chthoniobacterales bacterium]|nr:hypothetical protein [Chthoniobacterales bacterium]
MSAKAGDGIAVAAGCRKASGAGDTDTVVTADAEGKADGEASRWSELNWSSADCPRSGGLCDPPLGRAVESGIAVGSSTGVARLTGVGVGLAAGLVFGVCIPAGINNRPR